VFGALSLVIITQIYAVNFKFKKLKKLQSPLHLKELGKTRIAIKLKSAIWWKNERNWKFLKQKQFKKLGD